MNESHLSKKPNLIAMFNYYFASGISADFSYGSNILLLALLYKANQLYFPRNAEEEPAAFKVSNPELSSLTGIPNKSIPRMRDRLRKYDYQGRWLLRYEQGTTRSAGLYTLNYDLLCDKGAIKSRQSDEETTTKTQNGRQIVATLGSKSEDFEDDLIPTITTNLPTTTEGSSVDAPLEEEPLSDTMTNIRNLQALLHIKYAAQIGGGPSDGHCRQAIDRFEFHRLEEAIERMPVALRPEITKQNIVNTVIKYVENPNWGRIIDRIPESGLIGAKRDEFERELSRMEGEFALALADDSEDWLPKKQQYLEQQYPKINHLRGLLGKEPMPESVLEMDDA